MRPSTRCWIRTWPPGMAAFVALCARKRGSSTNNPTAIAMVVAKVTASVPRPIVTPVPAAASDPERISQRVPMTSVS